MTQGLKGDKEGDKRASKCVIYIFITTNLVDPDRLLPVQAALLASPSTLLGAAAHAKDNVAGLPIRAFVSLAFKDDLVTLGRAAGHVKREVRCVVEDLLAAAGGTLPHDDAAAPAAFVARHLRLREHAWEDLLLDHAHTATAAIWARVDVSVRGCARAAAVVAQHPLLNHKLSSTKRNWYSVNVEFLEKRAERIGRTSMLAPL